MNFKIPHNIYIEFVKGKSKETIKTYQAMIKKMFREIWKTNVFSVDKLTQFDVVKNYINNSKLSVPSKKIITIAAVMMLKAAKAPQLLIDEYGKMARQFRIEDSAMRKDRSATAKERLALIDWPQVIEVRNVYKECMDDPKCLSEMTEGETKRWHMKYVTLSLFTMIPPQRGQVFYNCYIDNDVPGSNLFDTKASQLIVRNEKTTRTYGIRTIPIPKELNDIVKKWKSHVGSPYLLMPNNKNKQLSSPAWTQFMKSIFLRDVSTDMLRKIYITHMINELGIDIEERSRLALLMGHSPSVQQHGYYKSDW